MHSRQLFFRGGSSFAASVLTGDDSIAYDRSFA